MSRTERLPLTGGPLQRLAALAGWTHGQMWTALVGVVLAAILLASSYPAASRGENVSPAPTPAGATP